MSYGKINLAQFKMEGLELLVKLKILTLAEASHYDNLDKAGGMIEKDARQLIVVASFAKNILDHLNNPKPPFSPITEAQAMKYIQEYAQKNLAEIRQLYPQPPEDSLGLAPLVESQLMSQAEALRYNELDKEGILLAGDRAKLISLRERVEPILERLDPKIPGSKKGIMEKVQDELHQGLTGIRQTYAIPAEDWLGLKSLVKLGVMNEAEAQFYNNQYQSGGLLQEDRKKLVALGRYVNASLEEFKQLPQADKEVGMESLRDHAIHQVNQIRDTYSPTQLPPGAAPAAPSKQGPKSGEYAAPPPPENAAPQNEDANEAEEDQRDIQP